MDSFDKFFRPMLPLSIFLQIGDQLALKRCPPLTNYVSQTVRTAVSFDKPNTHTGAGAVCKFVNGVPYTAEETE